MNDKMFVLAITGPTGSGKSTVGERLAKQLPRCVNIDADHIKHMIVSGFYVDEANPEDEVGWGFSEWALVGESIGLLTKNFLNHDFSVIINGYIDQPAWDNIEKIVKISEKVLLLPKINVTLKRDAARNASAKMGEVAVHRHHKHFSTPEFKDFVNIDTSDQSIDDTVNEIAKLIGNQE